MRRTEQPSTTKAVVPGLPLDGASAGAGQVLITGGLTLLKGLVITMGHNLLTWIRPEPPKELLSSLVEIYVQRIDNQPISIFDVTKLPIQVVEFSPMLRHSFLALMIRFSYDNFYAGVRSEAVQYYKASAGRMLFPQVLYPTVSVDVLASLCLLCLSEIEGMSDFCPIFSSLPG